MHQQGYLYDKPLKELLTQKLQSSHYQRTRMLMESRVKFPQKAGALQGCKILLNMKIEPKN